MNEFQFGNNSSKAVGWKQLPLRLCPPIEEDFSIIITEGSLFPDSCASCLSLIAVDNPAGPAPTIKTSHSSFSLYIS